jgi:hypothetical protein
MWKKAVLIAICIMFLSSAFPLRQAIGAGTIISVEPPGNYGLNLGDTFSINITVSDVTDLKSWQFYLYYQSSVLNGTSIVEGPFLKAKNQTYFIYDFTDKYNATYGYMNVACTLLSNITGVNGSGTLATVTFKVVGSGGSILHLDTTKLLDSSHPQNLIPHTTVDGQAYVGSVDVAVSEIDAPLNIPVGSVAYVNVTAQNKGQFPETFDVNLYDDGTFIETKTAVNVAAGASQILNYTWDTTGLPTGEHTLNATAPKVVGEADTTDNTLSLTVYLGIRDLAITSVTPKTIVAQGYTAIYNVTVQNNGQATETSSVTLYYDSQIIGTETNPLAGGAQEIITFTWNTTGVSIGNHTLSAYVSPILGETNISNNNFTRLVAVSIAGDITSAAGWPDGKVDMRDVAYVAKRFGTNPSNPLWDPNADFTGPTAGVPDGTVDMRDVALVARNFGEHYP